jgi:hypothetical protein
MVTAVESNRGQYSNYCVPTEDSGGVPCSEDMSRPRRMGYHAHNSMFSEWCTVASLEICYNAL